MNDKRLQANLEHNLGPVIVEALRNPNVVEILLNSRTAGCGSRSWGRS
jgi:hypothetical protein